MPAGWSHQLADSCLSAFSVLAGKKPPPCWRGFKWKQIQFSNPLGLAGGVDKSARHIRAWQALGAGFIEVGTITPLPQKVNPGRVLKRNIGQKALWNYMGCPGEGALKISARLKALQRFKSVPVFANIGKNSNTALDLAYQDYTSCISKLSPYVDAFVINISSPNTEGLRSLAGSKYLKNLLEKIYQKSSGLAENRPIFVKWSPDMKEQDFLSALDTAGGCGVEGHIICNSSQELGRTGNAFPKTGGVSGAPLAKTAKKRLALAHKYLSRSRKKYLLISSGGVLKPEDLFERLDRGADLVQVYSALVFYGPHFFLKAKNLFQAK